jgi:nucleoside-triphosphatase THEP1
MRINSQVFIIAGDPQQGKTGFVIKLIERLKKSGFMMGGFVAPGEFRNHRRHSFKLTDLKTGRSKPLCVRTPVEGSHGVPFTFYPDGQQFGEQLLDPENLKDCDAVVIDEIGPLELQGKGWAGSVSILLEKADLKQIWVVRRSAVQQVIKKFGVNRAVVLDIESTSLEAAIRLITSS